MSGFVTASLSGSLGDAGWWLVHALRALVSSPWVVLAAPLTGALVITLLGPLLRRRTTAWIASLAMLWAFGVSVVVLVQMLSHPPSDRLRVATAWQWLSAGRFHAALTIQIDPLSMVMMLVVTGVGFLIHAYSVGYMHGEDEERRFFAYLNVFAFSMLVLVMAGNFVFLLVGWGLVGLSSYLLIGYYWQRPSAVAAAKKAFVMNAVGDVGIALATFLIFVHIGSVDYTTVFDSFTAKVGSGTSTANWIAVLLLLGAVAKSAQLPLQTWLPDAMEGPTPVSALIHAATMVTAGVYLVARMWPIYHDAPDIADLVAVIGALTLLMAGLIAFVQTDIKRVIAYSTMSQIGYMFVAAGIGAYSSAMFQLITHAFFKALLFLGAGVVAHALGGEQDIRKMGGMSRFLPYTRTLMWIGALALCGIPPLAGFFSKDQILDEALVRGGGIGYLVVVCGWIGALCTGFYTFRMIYLVFHAPPSDYALEHAPEHTAHGEGPFSMLWPITILAGLTIVGGVIGAGIVGDPLRVFLQPFVPSIPEATHTEELVASVVSLSLALTGILTARALYLRPSGRQRLVAAATAPIETILQARFGFDALYDRAFYRPAAALADGGRRLWEGPAIAGGIRLVESVTRWTGDRSAAVETGSVRLYAAAFAVGVAGVGGWLILQVIL